MLWNKQFLSSLLIFFTSSLFAQNEENYTYQRDYLTKFDKYSIDEGLSSLRILDIYQDHFGFLWIATEDGLNRFDGYEFLSYFENDSDSSSISNSHITSITEDIYGNLWIGTRDGLNLFNRKSEKFEIYRHDDFNENSLSNNYIRDLYADSSGVLWIETVDGVLNKYNIKEKNFRHFVHEKIKQPYYEYHDIYEDSKGDIWIGGRTMGPYRFDKVSETFYLFRADQKNPEKKRDKDVAAFLEDDRGTFWVSATDGVYQLNRSNEKFKKFLGTSTFDIIEDQEGNIWFATGNGVMRFNYSTHILTHFKSDHNNPHSLGEDDVNCVLEDHSGNIWFGTNNGLNKYSRKKYKFRHIYHIPGNKNTIVSNKISALMQDDEKQLWIGTFGDGLDRVDLTSNKIVHYQKDKSVENSLGANYVSDIYQDKAGEIWIGLWRGVGFNKYNKVTDDFSLYSMDPTSMKQDWYNDFLEDSKGNFWVGLWGAKGMQKFDRDNGVFLDTTFNPLRKNPINKIISALAMDSSHYLWVGCRSVRSIYKYDTVEEDINPLNFKSKDRDCRNGGTVDFVALSSGSVLIAREKGLSYYDKEKDQFFCYGLPESTNSIVGIEMGGTDSTAYVNTDNGMYQFGLNSKTFRKLGLSNENDRLTAFTLAGDLIYYQSGNKLYQFDINKKTAQPLDYNLDGAKVTSLLYDAPSNLWIGTNNKLFRYNLNTKAVKIFQREKNSRTSLTGELITKLYKDNEGKIWIGTIHGLNCYNIEKDSVTGYRYNPDKPNSLIHDHILSLQADEKNNIWVGTRGGLCVLDKKTGKFSSYNEPDQYSLTSRLTTAMYEDSKGNIWVGTSDKGLNRIQKENKHIDHFKHYSYDTASISNNYINCIYEDSKGRIWIGTNRGLNRFREQSLSFKRYLENSRFPSLKIMAIQEDDSGNLWISTKNGLIKFKPERHEVTIYNKADGLQGNRFSKASCKLFDGRLAFGGDNGLNIFTPGALDKNTIVPNARITGFKKFDKLIKTDFTFDNSIILNYDENFFTIHFSSMDFTAPEKNKYKYKLSGVDEKWVYSDHLNRASYTDIDPGEYLFKVMGSNNDDYWSNEAITLRIIINPPFYHTIWFYIVASVLILLIIGIYIRLRLLGLKKEKNNIELEQKLLRSQMNPHFIFNSLTSIQSYVMEQETSRANHYLAKFSKLLRLILENSRSNYITLAQEIQTIEHYLLLQKIRYRNKFDYEVEVQSDIDKQAIAIPPMLAQPFIENAIEHGFQSADYKGFLKVEIKKRSDKLYVSIEDNGIGIKNAVMRKKRQKASYKSLATQITDERIQNMNRFSKRKIRLKLTDLSDLDEKRNGTSVLLVMPFKENKVNL